MVEKPTYEKLEQRVKELEKDVFKLKQVEDALHQYEHIVSSSTDMLALLDKRFKYLATNKAYLEAFKLTPEQLIGNTVVDVFGKEFFNTVIKPNSTRCLGGEEVNYRNWFDFPAHGQRYMDINYYPYYNEDNKVVGFVVNGRNITKQKQAEEALQRKTHDLGKALLDTEEARDKMDGILKSVSDGLIVTDVYHRVVLMNSAAEDLLGVRFSMVIDRPIDFLIEEKTLREKVKKTLDKKETGYQFDFAMADADPVHPRIMRARTSEIHDKQGTDVGIVTIIQDVTREREVERMKTEFISTAAHELRSPLTSIQGFSEILLTREGLGDEEKKRFLTHINKHSARLAHIINDLLDISRIESEVGFSLNKMKCTAGEAIKSIVPFFQDLAQNHEIEVVMPGEDVELLLDKEKIEQVMKNILDNAIKYSPDGGKIRVKGELFDDCYQVSVEDRGIGMTPGQVDKYFDKFFRADASSVATIEGTGLGTTIVKYIVEAHGGKVWVESEFGKGTKVTFTIPLHS